MVLRSLSDSIEALYHLDCAESPGFRTTSTWFVKVCALGTRSIGAVLAGSKPAELASEDEDSLSVASGSEMML
jgi:hypothetical protein